MKKSVALVLSSGGSKGLAHIGVINELEKQGFEITSISGSSIGSVIGGVYAMGKLPEYTKWIKTLDPKSIWGLMDFTISTNGLLKGEKVFEKMKTFIPDMPIEEMNIPYAAVATDIINHEDVVFDSGSFYQAVRASIAIPTVFRPVNYKDTILVDGGVLNPIPADHVKRTEEDILVVVNLYGKGKKAKKTPAKSSKSGLPKTFNDILDSVSNYINSSDMKSLGYFSILTATTAAMVKRMARNSIDLYKPDIVINIPAGSSSTFDFHKADELIQLGIKETKKAILLNTSL